METSEAGVCRGDKGGKSWKKENSKAEMGEGIKEQIRGLGLSAPFTTRLSSF